MRLGRRTTSLFFVIHDPASATDMRCHNDDAPQMPGEVSADCGNGFLVSGSSIRVAYTTALKMDETLEKVPW